MNLVAAIEAFNLQGQPRIRLAGRGATAAPWPCCPGWARKSSSRARPPNPKLKVIVAGHRAAVRGSPAGHRAGHGAAGERAGGHGQGGPRRRGRSGLIRRRRARRRRSIRPPARPASSVGELVLPLVMLGIAPASTTRRPRTPRTRQRASSTAIGSPSRPMRVVPTGWKMVLAMSPASRASCSSLWYCAPGFHSSGWYGASAGWAQMRRVTRSESAATWRSSGVLR